MDSRENGNQIDLFKAEIDRLREREKATRQILVAISRTNDSEQPVFDMIVKFARKLCDASFAGLVLGKKGDALQRVVSSEN